MTAKAEVRPASDADLATLLTVLGERHWFTERLARQQRGGGVLLAYADWGHGTVVATWVEHVDDGPPVRLSEVCDILVKRL